MGSYFVSLAIALALAVVQAAVVADAEHMKSGLLCSQCKACDTEKCPPSDAYPHMTAFDDSLIAGALQSDYIKYGDRGVYSVPNVIGGVSAKNNSYFGWESTSGSASGFHRFRNYMDKCSDESYLSADKHGRVKLRALKKLSNLSQADWKSVNPPKNLNHREFRFWVSHSTGKCLTVLKGKTEKRTLGVADCAFDGTNPFQLFAFRFHYHKAFCCCGKYNE
ncbi:uncharacterized protein LOC130999659 isoform X2 [Salvia miltiorrhiza]|uniref:uncharacterized protein LOC130999659 isoform X2 n=1 Tax=Salvia miltiorrhiza TaxID=226208 RepID=UPI0025AB6307|nr:uncharacterized protein LOC130999659 isoform X2 [Salvia miltiorrhiza]